MRKGKLIRGIGLGFVVLFGGMTCFLAGYMAAADGVVQEMASPDGEFIARVRSHAALDGPAQSLWLGPQEGPVVEVARLAPDQEWCDAVVWSPDGKRVAFVIAGVEVAVYEVPGSHSLGRLPLLEPDGYPGSLEAREVAFSPDGRSVEFQECLRGRARCLSQQIVEVPGDSVASN